MQDSRAKRLVEMTMDAHAADWRPQSFDPGNRAEAAAVQELLASGVVHFVHDRIHEQLRGLVETRHPAREHLAAAELDALVAEHLGATPQTQYGRWFFYPWSGRLVHLLPQPEFDELRTSRNRNKITLEEQRQLRALRLGIVGLSVGQATAVTLALEGIGGCYRLADFDQLELSNMNRLRCGVHELGLNKAVITARAIVEIDPFVHVELFAAGVDDDNLEAFFLEGGKLDILYDECDSLDMKVRLRERARALRVPVLMETSDRGMLDVERFDLEPQRPLFHGLVGDLVASQLRGLSTHDKVPTVMKIIGQATMSSRMAASMVDIGTTLKTWPQLGSAVALGGALNADATRRICLGSFTASGRFHIDLEELVANATAKKLDAAPDYSIQTSPEALAIALPALTPLAAVAPLTVEHVRALVAHGVMAPTGGNCQPWRFVYSQQRRQLQCFHDRARSQNFLDFHDRGSHVGFGALLENLLLAAGELGLAAETEVFPDQPETDLVLRIRFGRAEAGASDPLARNIARRCTNRRLGERVALSPDVLGSLQRAAGVHGVQVRWLTDARALAEIGTVLGRGDRVRFMSKVMHRELMHEVRWNRAEVERTRDGIDVATMEMTPTDLAGLRLVSSWAVMAVAGRIGAGAGLEKPSRKSIAAASAVGLLLVEGTSPQDMLRCGRGMQRLWLCATQHELAFQPMTAITFLFHRLAAGGEGLSADDVRTLGELRERHDALFGLPATPELAPVMLFRLAKAEPPSARSLRRRVEDVLRIEP